MSKHFGIGPNGPYNMLLREGEEVSFQDEGISCQGKEKFEYSNSQEWKVSFQGKEQFVYSSSKKEEDIVHLKSQKEKKKTCDDCGAPFGSQGLKRHKRRNCLGALRRNAVDPENPLQCKNCLRTFKDEKGFSHHISRTIAKNIDCKDIEPTGYNYQKKKPAAEKHPAKKYFRDCDKCGKRFHSIKYVKSHLDKGRCLGSMLLMAKNPENHLQCKNCMRVFKHDVALNQHIAATVAKGIKCQKTLEKRVKCDMCGMSLFDKSTLKQHLRRCLGKRALEAKNAENSLQCNICMRVFKNELSLNQHIAKTVGKGINCREKLQHCDMSQMSNSDHVTVKTHLSNGGCATNNTDSFEKHGKKFNPNQIIVTPKDQCLSEGDLKVKMDKNRTDKPIDSANSEAPSNSRNADITLKRESTETVTSSDTLETLFIKEETMPLADDDNVKATAQSENHEISTYKLLLPMLPVKLEEDGSSQDSKMAHIEYFCSFCDYSCSSKEVVNLHMRTIHNFEPNVLNGDNLCYVYEGDKSTEPRIES